MTEKQSEIEKQHKKQATITGLICAGILSILMAGFISLVLLVPNTRLPLLITCVALLAICCIGLIAYKPNSLSHTPKASFSPSSITNLPLFI